MVVTNGGEEEKPYVAKGFVINSFTGDPVRDQHITNISFGPKKPPRKVGCHRHKWCYNTYYTEYIRLLTHKPCSLNCTSSQPVTIDRVKAHVSDISIGRRYLHFDASTHLLTLTLPRMNQKASCGSSIPSGELTNSSTSKDSSASLLL